MNQPHKTKKKAVSQNGVGFGGDWLNIDIATSGTYRVGIACIKAAEVDRYA